MAKNPKESSAKMAHAASEIMGLAREGGPLIHFKRELESALGGENLDLDFIERLDKVLRPYIDHAESLAASVLSQTKPKGKSK